MLESGFDWFNRLEKAGCSDGILKIAGNAVDDVMLSVQNAEEIVTENAACNLKERLYKRLFSIYIGAMVELLKEKMGEAAFSMNVLCSEPDRIEPELLLALNELKKSLDDNPDYLYEFFPVLEEKTEKTKENFKGYAAELIERYAESREGISKNIFGGKDAGKILSVLDTAAATKEHGRTVTGLETERGVIYYKPRDCMIDAFFSEIAEKYFSDVTVCAKLFAGKNYGFFSEVKTAPVATKDEIGKYFYRFGSLCALISVLSGMDIHYGNVIACGAFPVLIDLENLITPNEKKGSRLTNTVADNFVNSSIIRLSCLPQRGYVDKVFASALHECGGKLNHLPEYMGKKHDVTGHEEDYIKGFSDAYERLETHSDSILSALEKYPDMRIRNLYCGPISHYYILRRLVAPKNLKSNDCQKAELKKDEFSIKQGGKVFSKKIQDYDERYLLEGDLPYYFARLRETSLYGSDGLLLEDFFDLSPLDTVKKKMGELGQMDKKMQLDLIRHRLKHALYDQDEPESKIKITEKTPDKNTIISEIKRIFNLLVSEKIHAPDGTVFFSSSMAEYYFQSRWGLVFLQGDALLFCSFILSSPELSEIKKPALELFDELLPALESKVLLWEKAGIPAEVPVGMRLGLGSLVFALERAKETGSQKAALILDKFIRILPDKAPASPKISGFLKGNAGLVYALSFSKSEDKDIEKTRKEYIKALSDELLRDFRQGVCSDADLAAIGMSLVLAGESLFDSERKRAGEECFKKFVENNENVSAADGFFAATALEHSDKSEGPVMRCLLRALEREMKEENLLRSDSLESGNALRSLFLLKAQKFASSWEAKKRAQAILFSMIDRKNMNGEYISSPEKTANSFDASFLPGTLGIAALMRVCI